MGNTAADSYDEQIAALESALALPLPDSTRAQIEQDLGVLRAQRAAQLASSTAAKIKGTTNVSGTLHGNAIGVNLGTVQTFFAHPRPRLVRSLYPPCRSRRSMSSVRS